MIEITSAKEFDEVLDKGEIVVVDVYAPWCGPCKMITPSLEELENEYKGVTFVKVNADEVKDVADRLGVMSIPAIFTFSGETQLDKSVGFVAKEMLDSMVVRALGYEG